VDAPAGMELVNINYFYNLPDVANSHGVEVNPVFYEYKDGRKRWDDNSIHIDDDFPITIKLHFAAAKSGVYTIKDISLVLSRGFGPQKKYSLMTEKVPRRLAFASSEDLVEYKTIEFVTRQTSEGKTLTEPVVVVHKKPRGVPIPKRSDGSLLPDP